MKRSKLFKELGRTKKGEVAEKIVETELSLRGYCVLQPGRNQRYDLAVDKEAEMIRLQVKTSYHKRQNGAVVFDTSNNNTQRTYENVSKNYTKNQIDYFAVYCPDTDEVYYVPVEETGPSQMSLRIEEPDIQQEKNINWSTDYQINNVDLTR